MTTVGRDILAAEDPPIRMLWVEGSNVVNQAPDSHEVVRAFESIPFKVVVDAFMTDTAERADLVLPCALMMEQEDVEASYLHDFVHYVRPVLQAPGQARSDYWILSELGKRLDPPIILPDPETCFRRALDTPHLDASLEELRERNFVRARRRPVAYAGLQFDHPDGKYRFPEALHPEAPPPPGYPLRLLSLIRGEAIHSQILPEKQEMPPLVWVAPDCPSLEGLNLEEPVALVSPLGRLKVRVALLEGLHPEVVVYRRGDWMKLGGGANQLIAAVISDVGKGASYYQQYARLENE
jgi:anaerobic selenocysteine-containing dehydrogenase